MSKIITYLPLKESKKKKKNMKGEQRKDGTNRKHRASLIKN